MTGRRWSALAVVTLTAVFTALLGAGTSRATPRCPATENGLACAAQALASIRLPFESFSPATQFARLTYTNTPAPADARLHTVVVQAGSAAPSYIASLRAQSPGVIVLIYQSMWLRPTGDPAGETTCLPGGGSYPPEWYLRSSAGAPEPLSAVVPSAGYAMDFANSDYVKACAQHAVATALAMGADGVFLDGAATSVHWAQLPEPCGAASTTCTSDAAWQSAMTSALTDLASALHARGLVLFANVSGGNVDSCCGGGPAVWRRYVAPLDGALEESWTYGTDHQPLPAHQVAVAMNNVAWDEAHGKATIVNDDAAGCESCATLGLATELLIANGSTSYDIAAGVYRQYATWWPSYSAALRLGLPRGPYVVASDGLLVRRFTLGAVAVNLTAAPIADPEFGAVPAHSGLIR